MNRLTVTILLLSLVGNAMLGYLYLRAPAVSPEVSTATTHPRAGAPTEGGDAKAIDSASTPARTVPPQTAGAPTNWQELSSNGDVRALVANLRAAGFPPEVIRAMVVRMVGDRLADRYAAIAPPFWRRMSPSREHVAAQLKLDEERDAWIDSIMGGALGTSDSLTPAERVTRFGNLSDEKIDAIGSVERDYNQVRRAAAADRSPNMVDMMGEMHAQQQLLEEQRRADLAAILTPEELAEYEKRNSSAAWQTMSNVRSINITESEYDAMFRAQQSFNDAVSGLPMGGIQSPDVQMKQEAARSALIEQVKGILPDDRFNQYLESADFRYAQLSKTLSGFPSVNSEAKYRLFKLQTETQMALAPIYADKSISAAQREARRLEIVGPAAAEVDALLGRDAAAAYKKDPFGQMFDLPPPSGSPGG
jgi:hypothetical protein